MSVLSRSTLIVFIFFVIQYWTQVTTGNFEDSQIAFAILVVSAAWFIIWGPHDDFPQT